MPYIRSIPRTDPLLPNSAPRSLVFPTQILCRSLRVLSLRSLPHGATPPVLWEDKSVPVVLLPCHLLVISKSTGLLFFSLDSFPQLTEIWPLRTPCWPPHRL
uniref:Uncharacterized protein n=1 Tax=Arundo donax TaxID=35708 RepID=A0A0A9Q500_ARUDO